MEISFRFCLLFPLQTPFIPFLLCQSPCPGTRRLPLILWGLWDSVPLYQFPLSTCPRRLLSIKIKWGETTVNSHRTCINLWVLRFLVSAPFVLEINSVLYFLWINIVCPQVVLNKQVCIFLKVFNICCNVCHLTYVSSLFFLSVSHAPVNFTPPSSFRPLPHCSLNTCQLWSLITLLLIAWRICGSSFSILPLGQLQ